jgi:hypothetical protein
MCRCVALSCCPQKSELDQFIGQKLPHRFGSAAADGFGVLVEGLGEPRRYVNPKARLLLVSRSRDGTLDGSARVRLASSSGDRVTVRRVLLAMGYSLSVQCA